MTVSDVIEEVIKNAVHDKAVALAEIPTELSVKLNELDILVLKMMAEDMGKSEDAVATLCFKLGMSGLADHLTSEGE